MFGWKLIRESEIELQQALHDKELAILQLKLDEAARYNVKLEYQVEYWQERADDERERADRVADALNLQNGLPEVTNTSKREKVAAKKDEKAEAERQEKQIAELFAESVGTDFDMEGLELTDELKAAAEKMVGKQGQKAKA